jgi:hypothetical protein
MNKIRTVESSDEIQNIIKLIDAVIPMDYEKSTDFEKMDISNVVIQDSRTIPTVTPKQIGFWAIIDSIILQIDFDDVDYKQKYVEILKNTLGQMLTLEEKKIFENDLYNLSQNRSIENILNQTEYSGYFSDDGLEYLGYLLVSRGKGFYDMCLISAANLTNSLNTISHNKQQLDNLEFEEIMYVFQ